MTMLKHLLGYSPVSVATGLVGLASVYVFTRALGGEDYGRFVLMLSAMALIHTLSLTWVEAAAYRFGGKALEEGNLPGYYRTSLTLALRSLALTMLGTLILWAIFAGDAAYTRVIPWLFALMVAETFGRLALEAHRAHQRVGRYALMMTGHIIIGFLIGAGFAHAGGYGASAPFIGMFVAAILVLLREGPWLLKQAAGGTMQTARTKAWLGYGIPVAAALALDIVLSVSDRFLINIYLDEAAVGAYAAGYGIADKPVLLICAWAALATSPLVMAAYESEGKAAASEASRGLFGAILMVGLPAATGLALVAEPLAMTIVSEDLRDQAAQIIPFIAFAGLLNGLLIHYVSESFQLAHRTGQHALLMIIPAGANIILNLILLPLFGIMGAVYATLTSYALGVLVLGVFGRRLLPLPIPVGEIIKTGLASLAMVPVIHAMPDFGGWGELFLKVAAGGATYTIFALALDAGGARRMLGERITARGQAQP